jgi:hypothetical protein
MLVPLRATKVGLFYDLQEEFFLRLHPIPQNILPGVSVEYQAFEDEKGASYPDESTLEFPECADVQDHQTV